MTFVSWKKALLAAAYCVGPLVSAPRQAQAQTDLHEGVAATTNTAIEAEHRVVIDGSSRAPLWRLR
jgi:hypothetical protein